jgi:hypothetical protein
LEADLAWSVLDLKYVRRVADSAEWLLLKDLVAFAADHEKKNRVMIHSLGRAPEGVLGCTGYRPKGR